MRVRVSAQRLVFPQRCVCCGEPPTTARAVVATRTKGVRVIRTQEKAWEFPFCADCDSHAADFPSSFNDGHAIVNFLSGGIGLPILLRARRAALKLSQSKMKPSCACPDAAVTYDGWQGTVHTFTFASPDYVQLFAAANADKLAGRLEGWPRPDRTEPLVPIETPGNFWAGAFLGAIGWGTVLFINLVSHH